MTTTTKGSINVNTIRFNRKSSQYLCKKYRLMRIFFCHESECQRFKRIRHLAINADV